MKQLLILISVLLLSCRNEVAQIDNSPAIASSKAYQSYLNATDERILHLVSDHWNSTHILDYYKENGALFQVPSCDISSKSTLPKINGFDRYLDSNCVIYKALSQLEEQYNWGKMSSKARADVRRYYQQHVNPDYVISRKKQLTDRLLKDESNQKEGCNKHLAYRLKLLAKERDISIDEKLSGVLANRGITLLEIDKESEDQWEIELKDWKWCISANP